MKEFNVIIYNINSKEFEPYNVIPYLVNCYNKKKNKPKTFDEFKEFIKNNSMYQWWARCEYEIILSPWPYTSSPSERYDKKGEDDIEAWKEHWKKHLKECDKIDVHYQVMMNIDVITNLFIDIINALMFIKCSKEELASMLAERDYIGLEFQKLIKHED